MSAGNADDSSSKWDWIVLTTILVSISLMFGWMYYIAH